MHAETESGRSTVVSALNSCFLVVLALLSLASCGDLGEREKGTHFGTLSLPMGIEIANERYRLVHSVFDVKGPEQAVVSADVVPEGGSLTITLPEGAYVVSLRTGWELQLLGNRGWQPVAAQLVGGPTLTAMIKPFETTHVRFQFSTAQGTVDVDPGVLSIEIDVLERMNTTDVVQVATNDAQTCTLGKEGEVRCQDQRIGVGGRATSVVLGDAHACAILEGGRLRCWGNGGDGRLGYGNTRSINDDATLQAAGDVDVGGQVTQVAAGSQHTCALLVGGTVRCWGLGVTGALGYGNRNAIGDDEVPRTAGDVPIGGIATQIAAGGVNTCALLEGGSLRCWGFSDLVGQTFGDDEPASAAPLRGFGAPAKQVAMGVSHHCTVLVNDRVECQAFSSPRYLPTTDHLTGGMVGAGVVEIAAGFVHNCVRLMSGEVRCWGYNAQAQLGVPVTVAGTSVPASRAVTVPGFSRPVDLTIGKNRSCVALADGTVRCWPSTP